MASRSTSQYKPLPERLRNLLDPLLVFFLTLATYVSTMPRKITLEDAGLFQMVCNLGGISHPPGYPLFTLLCRQMTITPTVFNGNMISTIFACIALVIFYRIVLLLTTDRLTAFIAALSYGFSATFWSQAIIIEVYSLAALLFMLAWWLALRFVDLPSRSRWAGLCFAVGLGLANHWPLMVLSCMGVFAALLARWQYLLLALKSPWFWLLSLACIAAGLLPYLSLMMSPEPVVAVHGGVTSMTDLLRYVARSSYIDQQETAGLVDKLQYMRWLAGETVQQLGLITLPFVIIGLVSSCRRWSFTASSSVVLIYLATSFILLMLVGFNYSSLQRAIFMPFPLIAYSALSIWYAVGIRTIMARVGKKSWQASMVVTIFAVSIVFMANYFRSDRSGAHLADAYARTVLGSLPPDAILFVHGDNEVGSIGYMNRVEGVRPDVELRNHEDLVFSNRIGSAYDVDAVRITRLVEFLETTQRPVFATSAIIRPMTNYGLVKRLNKGGASDTRINPKIDFFLSYLLDQYEQDLLQDDHEKHFLFALLGRFGNQYAMYVRADSQQNVARDGFDLAATAQFKRLQLTYPGRLEMLKSWLGQPAGSRSKAEILRLAEATTAVMPFYALPESESALYALHGRAYMLETPTYDRAADYFERSVNTLPTQANPSACLLLETYQVLKQSEALARLQHRFPEMSCD
jgi:hypothetical protein